MQKKIRSDPSEDGFFSKFANSDVDVVRGEMSKIFKEILEKNKGMVAKNEISGNFINLKSKAVILGDLSKELGKKIPSTKLNEMSSPKDALSWFVSQFEGIKPVPQVVLPPNLTIVTERLPKKERKRVAPPRLSMRQKIAREAKKQSQKVTEVEPEAEKPQESATEAKQ